MSPTTARLPAVEQLRELLKKGQARKGLGAFESEAKESGKSLGLEKFSRFQSISTDVQSFCRSALDFTPFRVVFAWI